MQDMDGKSKRRHFSFQVENQSTFIYCFTFSYDANARNLSKHVRAVMHFVVAEMVCNMCVLCAVCTNATATATNQNGFFKTKMKTTPKN